MINPKQFYESLKRNNVNFFTGVPDSLLKDICAYISDNSSSKNHIIGANEGGCVALAMGYYLSSNKVPLVYMQNSGFGNALNPLLSLADTKVYGIPMILMIGWRGEPGTKDEPQHIKQGEVSEILLKSLKIPYLIISSDTDNFDELINYAVTQSQINNEPFAILIRKGTFENYSLKNKVLTNYDLSREEAINEIMKYISKNDIVVSTTGKTSRELFEYRANNNQDHKQDFLTVGGMGHANQIALGISLNKPDRTVYCFDGDGAILMHSGSLGIIGQLKPKKFKHIVFNNGAHDSVGGQPTIGFEIKLKEIAEKFNYKKVFEIKNKSEFEQTFIEFQNEEGPCLLEIKVNKGARKDLGRPTVQPNENKINLMKFINEI